MARTSAKQTARTNMREALWPGSEDTMWPQPSERGWTRLPRTFPVVVEIINHVVGESIDLGRTLLTLYSSAFAEGIVEVVDEELMASLSGLTKKTWTSRMVRLEELGFISVKPKRHRRFGYVLLVHPVLALRELRIQKKVPDELWVLFEQLHAEYNANEPVLSQVIDASYVPPEAAEAAPLASITSGPAFPGMDTPQAPRPAPTRLKSLRGKTRVSK